jgi:hypothetical protein
MNSSISEKRVVLRKRLVLNHNFFFISVMIVSAFALMLIGLLIGLFQPIAFLCVLILSLSHLSQNMRTETWIVEEK